MFEYFTMVVIPGSSLQDWEMWLNKNSKKGWRLHTVIPETEHFHMMIVIERRLSLIERVKQAAINIFLKGEKTWKQKK